MAINRNDGALLVEDVKTKARYRTNAFTPTTHITTRDGERVRIHPLVIKHMVKVGHIFEAIGVVNNRKMKRLK